VAETSASSRPEIQGVKAHAAAADGSQEPIGDRIAEIAEDDARTDVRDDASGFVATADRAHLIKPPQRTDSHAQERLEQDAGVRMRVSPRPSRRWFQPPRVTA
jgi:hypothetical protein